MPFCKVERCAKSALETAVPGSYQRLERLALWAGTRAHQRFQLDSENRWNAPRLRLAHASAIFPSPKYESWNRGISQ